MNSSDVPWRDDLENSRDLSKGWRKKRKRMTYPTSKVASAPATCLGINAGQVTTQN